MSESTQTAELVAALQAAREAEALHREAQGVVRTAEMLRLAALRDVLAAYVEGHAEARAFFALSVLAGDKPRLWLDLVHWVEMAPDSRSYRLISDRDTGRESLFETRDQNEMVKFTKSWMAHRLVERARSLARPPAQPPLPIQGYSTGALILAMVSGFSTGVLVLFTAGIALVRLW